MFCSDCLLCFVRAIHGRIDQAKQILLLDRKSQGAARLCMELASFFVMWSVFGCHIFDILVMLLWTNGRLSYSRYMLWLSAKLLNERDSVRLIWLSNDGLDMKTAGLLQ